MTFIESLDIFYSYLDIMSVFPSDYFNVPLPYVLWVMFSFKCSVFFIAWAVCQTAYILTCYYFKRLFYKNKYYTDSLILCMTSNTTSYNFMDVLM